MIARLLLQTVLWVIGLGALLFWPAGTLYWPAAWLYLATTAVLGLGAGLWLARVDPALLKERMRPIMQKGQPAADKWFMLAFGVAAFGWFMVVGLDRRWHGSDMPMALPALGYAPLLGATALMLRVVRENSFAAPVVKVQSERGHHVIDTGPYAWVRHPMYSGIVLYFAAMALLLGSWWGLALSPIFFALFSVRAGIEERALVDGLPGYADYLARVRYRLVPGVW
ncbi:MAG: isoprenylcysteine carboxylmethyltransferase family protein [Bradyrhizobium sp.]